MILEWVSMEHIFGFSSSVVMLNYVMTLNESEKLRIVIKNWDIDMLLYTIDKDIYHIQHCLLHKTKNTFF